MQEADSRTEQCHWSVWERSPRAELEMGGGHGGRAGVLSWLASYRSEEGG